MVACCRLEKNHLRTICKANSVVDYAWDDPYGEKLLILQVFENKSNTYDPQKPGLKAPLIYDNDVYIKFAQSFTKYIFTAVVPVSSILMFASINYLSFYNLFFF